MPAPTAAAALNALHTRADPDKACHALRFFKTGPGEYGEGDQFLGIRMPPLRDLARTFQPLPLGEIRGLLTSPWHEARMLALLVMVRQYKAARRDPAARDTLHRLYLDHTAHVNNWDLVDSSAPHLVGAHLRPDDRALLDRLAASSLLWDRRIAIIATFSFIRQGEFGDAFRIAEMLLADEHDLIHKAVGWMLREVGKRSQEAEESFLRMHYARMPRTMLRYAIERFPEPLRQAYLHGQV
ncbi:MAG: DNA alkylation repair protein [Rhodothermaceae bacterium]|nr:DNA alkylation repair protein [Rhodothermaceae bacterium]